MDDDTAFAAVLSMGLGTYGHKADVAPAAEALEIVAQRGYSLAVVEYARGGREFLRQYKAVDPLLATVVVTALPDRATAVEFLRGGAGALALDYIEKVEPNLVARIAATIDRYFIRVEAGGFVADRAGRQGFYEGRPLELTQPEFMLFLLFMSRPYQPVTYEEMALAVHGVAMSKDEAYSAMRSTVSRLRRRLNEAAGRRNVLERHYGGGIHFIPEGVARSDISRVKAGSG